LAEELESTHVGVICLTPENLTASWLLFEAGALSKLHKDALVCTYLVGVDYSAVTGPLADFQHTPATKEDTHQMVKSINAAIDEGQGRLTDTQLDRAFKRCWSELQRCLETLPEPQEAIPPPRKAEDMLQEVLEVVRGLAKTPTPIPRFHDRLLSIFAGIRSAEELVQRKLTHDQELEQIKRELEQTIEDMDRSRQEFDRLESLLQEPATMSRRKKTPSNDTHNQRTPTLPPAHSLRPSRRRVPRGQTRKT
jgi:hypothetical protein